MKLFRFKSTKAQIIMMVIVSAAVSILFFSVYTFRNVARRFEQTIEEGYQLSLNAVGDKLGQALEEMHRVASGLTYRGGIIAQVEDYLMTRDVLRRRELARQVLEQMNLHDFQSQVVGSSCFYFPGEAPEAFITNAVGQLVPPDRPLFFNRYPYTEFFVPGISEESGKYVLSLARFGGNVDGRDFYVYMESDSDFLESLFSQIQDGSGKQMAICLVDAGGIVRYALGEFPFEAGESFDEEEARRVFVPFSYAAPHWSLYLCVPNEEYRRVYRSFFLEVVTLILIYAVFAAFMAFRIYRAAYRPLDTFVKELSGRGVEGLYGHRGANSSELGECQEKIEQMRVEICRLLAQVEQDSRQNAYLENQLLLSRINPHFIHNTLNSIGLEAAGQGETQLAETLRALNNLLYHNLGKNKVTTLRDELRAADDYIYLQRRIQSFGYEKEIDLPQELLDMQMPGFVLQPIIENCFQHGKARNLEIRLGAFYRDARLCLMIEDNGQGISREKQEHLNQELLEISAHGAGIGLRYVSSALKLFFAGGVTLAAGPGREGRGTRITICIQI